MQAHESPALLAALLAPFGAPMQWRPTAAFATLIEFYRTRQVAPAGGDGRDLLLLQWGAYDWGEGEFFELDLTRQFIVADGEHDDIFQLSLTFRYAPDEALWALGASNHACGSRAELASFAHEVLASAPVRLAEARTPAQVLLRYDPAG
jgi:hypothetical protein